MSSNPLSNVETTYVVRPGDTLGAIARAHGTTTVQLIELNGIRDPDRLRVGQRLTVKRNHVCAIVPLFIDRSRNPIEGLRYRLESADAPIFEGVSQLNGLGERFVTHAVGEIVHILVQRRDGTWKLIHETLAAIGEKLVTLKSGLSCFRLSTEPHPMTPDGVPVEDPPNDRKPRAVPPGTPNHGRGDMHHPAADGSDKGMKGLLGKTAQGAAEAKFSRDLPDLQKHFALYTDAPITDADWDDASKRIGCEVEVIKAFAFVETGTSAFDRLNRPSIQYERHIFSKHSNHRFDSANADISSRKTYVRAKVDKEGHRVAAAERYTTDPYERFERAYLLDEDAAIQACSWGRFQILGENYRALKFSTPHELMAAACTSEQRHLLALFVPFAMTKRNKTRGTLREALIQKNWVNAAALYNGEIFRVFDYDNRLKVAYEKIKAGQLHV